MNSFFRFLSRSLRSIGDDVSIHSICVNNLFGFVSQSNYQLIEFFSSDLTRCRFLMRKFHINYYEYRWLLCARSVTFSARSYGNYWQIFLFSHFITWQMTFVIFLLLLLFFSLFSSSLLFTFIDCFKQALYRAFKCKKSISIKLKRMKQLEFSVDQRIKLRYHFFTRIFFLSLFATAWGMSVHKGMLNWLLSLCSFVYYFITNAISGRRRTVSRK